MGFIIFFVSFAAFLLAAWIAVLKTRIRHLEDTNAHLNQKVAYFEKSRVPVTAAAPEKPCCKPAEPVCKPEVKKAAESVPVVTPSKVARGVVLKCGKVKCLVKWSDGKYEKLMKDKVQELLLAGDLMVAPNKNVALHNV